jgi:hypothetical protein
LPGKTARRRWLLTRRCAGQFCNRPRCAISLALLAGTKECKKKNFRGNGSARRFPRELVADAVSLKQIKLARQSGVPAATTNCRWRD